MVCQDKKYKIGIDARMYGPKQTGIGNYIKNLINNLATLDKENDYIIFLLDGEFDRFVLPGSNFKKIKVSSYWYSWEEQVVLPWQLAKENLDLIHFPHFNSPILYRGKSVVTIHDITPLFFPGHKMGSFVRRAGFQAVFRHSVKHAFKIIAVSESTKSDICKHFNLRPDKIKVIYEGVDLGKFTINAGEQNSLQLDEKKQRTENEAELCKRYKIKKPFIFYTGVWRNHKNLVGLIKAFNVVINKHQLDYDLVLGGEENPFYPEIRRTWEELNLGGRIIRPGFIKNEDLPSFYRAASLVVVPSFYEGFGLVGLEAMASGTPVATSNCTALPEVLGSAAAYFDPDDHEDMAKTINDVLTGEGLRKKLISAGFEQIKKYKWIKMAEETLEVYKEILMR